MSKRGKAAKAAVATVAVAQPRAAPAAAANGPAAVKPAAMAAVPGYPAIAARVAHPSPSNLGIAWKPSGAGAGELQLAYEGPLAAAEGLQVRTGTLRAGGAPWAEQRDVKLVRERAGRFVGTVAVPSGMPVEAVELAFHAGDAWDNGGQAPLGYYEWSVRERQLAVR
jgi:hypothetical protein